MSEKGRFLLKKGRIIIIRKVKMLDTQWFNCEKVLAGIGVAGFLIYGCRISGSGKQLKLLHPQSGVIQYAKVPKCVWMHPQSGVAECGEGSK